MFTFRKSTPSSVDKGWAWFILLGDVLSFNNGNFHSYVNTKYPGELEIKDTTESDTSVSNVDILLEKNVSDTLATNLYEEHDDFNFSVVNFSYLCSNIPYSPAYGVYISQLIRYARACSCFLEYFLTIGMFKTFGLFFVQYQRKYSTTASVLSLVLSVQTIVASVSSIFIMGIGTTYLGERLMVILAAILGLGSNLGNAFAPQPSLLFFTQSTLYALTSESAHLSAMLILGKYFEKRRGMAYAVANFGAGIGGLVLPQLVTYLFDEYGLRGTLIIIGGLHLHFFPIGLLMRPIERETTKSQNIKEIENQRLIKQEGNPGRFSESKEIKEQNDEHKIQDADTASNCLLHKHEKENGNVITLLPINSEDELNHPSSKNECSDDDTVRKSIGKSDFKNSTLNLEKYSTQTERRKGLCFRFMFKIFDFSLFKNGRFNLLMTSSLLIAAACTIPVAYIPPFAKDQKIQSAMIGYLVTFSSASDLVGRFLFIFIADNKIIQKHHMMTIAMVLHGIVCLTAVFCTNFVSLAIFSILEAALGGVYYSLINILLVEFIGLKSLNHGLAVNRMTRGLSIAITSTLIGVIRDNTGSYVGGFYLMGICSIIGGAILLFKPCVSNNEKDS